MANGFEAHRDYHDTDNQQRVQQMIDAGVDVLDRFTTWIGEGVEVRDPTGVRILPGCYLVDVTIGAGTTIGPNAVLRNVTIGERCSLESCTINIEPRDVEHPVTLLDDVRVGPYVLIRRDCHLATGVVVGAHAEIVRSTLGEWVTVSHHAYVGDATVGPLADIGAGVTVSNYSPETMRYAMAVGRKDAPPETKIGAGAYIADGTALVAPVEIGELWETQHNEVVGPGVLSLSDADLVAVRAEIDDWRASSEAGEEWPQEGTVAGPASRLIARVIEQPVVSAVLDKLFEHGGENVLLGTQ